MFVAKECCEKDGLAALGIGNHSEYRTLHELQLLVLTTDGAGITSRLTRLVDIWPSVFCLPSSISLACWLGWPDKPAARQQLTSLIPPDRIHTSTVSLPLALQRTSP